MAFLTLQPAVALAMAFVATVSAAPAPDANSPSNTCVSYGVDFQPGGTYFQNITSPLPFTFVSIFEGCNTDICQNLLVDPNGNEYQCSNTDLTPADTNQLSTCQIDDDQMFSGEWTIILNSNNGDGSPIAYMREFSLTVGIPTTITYTPTVTATALITDYANVTTILTTDITTHANTTITDPAETIAPTLYVTPTLTTTVTFTLGTVTTTAHVVDPTVITETTVAQCTVPPAQQWPDPWLDFTPTLYQIPALETPKWSWFWARDGEKPQAEREKYVQERKERVAAQQNKNVKRGLESSITTITQMDTSLYPTVTITEVASTSTVVITSMSTTSTTELTTITVLEGTTSYPTDIITLPTTTITKHKYTLITDTISTVTLYPTVWVDTTTTPYWPAAICTDKGGFMW